MKKKLRLIALMAINGILIGTVLQTFFLSLVLATNIEAQNIQSVRDVTLIGEFENASIEQCFKVIENKTNYVFNYNENDLNNTILINYKSKNNSVSDFLIELSKEGKLKFRQVNNTINVRQYVGNNGQVPEVEVIIQGITITGKVTDENGQGLPGANIIEKGTSNGVVTDLDGNYAMTLPEDATLVVSFIGYISQEVLIARRSIIDIQLVIDAKQLQEVVVTGYQTIKRSEIVGAVGVVDTEEMTKVQSASVAEMLQGRAAGVTVTSSGAPGQVSSVKIRGLSSFSGQDGPLYVIDGMFSDNLSPEFNPADIESMQVLKDASATALYGSRGMNGVIVITTRKGKQGPMKVNYTGYYGVQEIPKSLPLTDEQTFTEINNLTYTNNNETPQNLNQGVNTDWQDALFQMGSITEHDLRFSGGTANSNYSVSMNYFDQKGAIIETDFKRYQIRVNTEAKRGRFKIGENIQFSRSERTNINANPFIDIVRMLPTIPVYDPSNTSGFGYGDDNNATFGTNPVGAQQHYNDTDQSNRVFGSVYGEFEIFPFLKYKLNLGLDYSQRSSKYYERIGAIRMNNPDGGPSLLDDTNTSSTRLLAEHTLNYNQVFGKHTLSALAGYTSQQDHLEVLGSHIEGLPGEFWVQDNGTSGARTFGREATAGLRSLLGSFKYSFDDRYLLLFNIRRDGSSKFGKDNQYANFPSVSGAWRISNESFMAGSKNLFSDLKLRASYGTVGNQAIQDYATQQVLALNQNYVLNGQVVSGITNLQLVNPDLRWESKTTTNIGVDMGLFTNKLMFSADYFVSDAKDLLLQVPIPLASGNRGSNPLANVGHIQNSGLELALTYQNDDAAEFQYSIAANGTFLNSEIKALVEEAGNIPIFGAGNVIRNAVGDPVASFFVLKTAGIFQNQSEVDTWQVQPGARPGDVKYVDVNGDGIINFDDRTVVGDAMPDFEYSLSFNATWKGFDASIYFVGIVGNYAYNELNWWMGRYDDNGNYRSDVTYWTGEGTSNSAPKPIHSDASMNPISESDRWVESSDYFRLKNLQIGWTFPTTIMEKMRLSNLRIYVTGQNLFTVTNYSGSDPEVVGAVGNNLSGDGGFLGRGYDNGGFPSLRSFMVGLQIGF